MKKTSILELLSDIRKLLLLRKDALTVEEAALFTGYEVSYLRKLCSQRKIIHYKSAGGGRQTYFDPRELSQFLKANRIKTSAELDKEAEAFVSPKKR